MHSGRSTATTPFGVLTFMALDLPRAFTWQPDRIAATGNGAARTAYSGPNVPESGDKSGDIDSLRPIQLWLPTFFGSVARPELRADMQRLFRARTTEKVMWTVPGWSGPACWKQKGVSVGCING